MADDIDIEEHDLMENPRIKSMFPDLLFLKQEILDPYDAENKNQDTLQISKEYGSINPSFVVTKTEPLTEESHTTSEVSTQLESLNSATIFKTKIILGSKPNQQKEYDKKLKCKVSVPVRNVKDYLSQSTRYCDNCLILFPSKQNFKNHLCFDNYLSQKKEKRNGKEVKQKLLNISTKNDKNEKIKSLNNCFHCNILFSSQKSLIDHLYDVLESKISSKSKTIEDECITNLDNLNRDNNSEAANDGNAAEYVYQCHICSYYFNQSKFYEMHLLKKHSLKNTNDTPRVIFNPKCKYCHVEYIDTKCYNLHMIKKHKDIVTKVVGNISQNNEDIYSESSFSKEESPDEFQTNKNVSPGLPKNSLVPNNTPKAFLNEGYNVMFKSILFKCLECHIHFLSSNIAINHEEHNQMLINWKCSQCLKFFKRNDEKLHSEQHLHSTSFIVYDLCEADSGKVLIKCPNCTVHFHEGDFVNHKPYCGKIQFDSTYCSHCDILVSGKTMKLHKLNHKKILDSDFVFIDFGKQVMSSLNLNDKKVLKRKAQQNKSIKRSKRKKTNMDYSSGSDSDLTPLSVVVKHTKSKMKKRESEVIDNYSDEPISTTSKQNEGNVSDVASEFVPDDESRSDLELSVDAKFAKLIKRKLLAKTRKTAETKKFNFKHIGQLVLLQLTYCDFCECFITARFHIDFHLKSLCTEIQKRVCKMCGIVVTGKASMSHKAFHKLNPKLKLKDFTFYDMKTFEIIHPPIPKYPKCGICEIHFTSKTDIVGHVCTEIKFMQCHICNIKLSDIAFKLHMPFHSYLLENKERKTLDLDKQSSLGIQNVTDNNKSKDFDINKHNERLSESQNTTDKRALCFLFSCKTCNTSVSTYDELIKHCHLHCDKSEIGLKTETCELCNLKFETYSFQLHQDLHSQGFTKESFKLIYIDIFYFGSSNEEWTKHVFESLSKEEEAIILENSIYKSEHRIVMEITQQGPWNLTMYRCEKCRCFIDNVFMYKHFKNCVGKYTINPCKFCGINLISVSIRTEHEDTVHKNGGITLKSYRIVSFNRKEQAVLNSAITNRNNSYILYQCRNCNGIVDKKVLHQCLENLEKCTYCGLLLYDVNYDEHVSKHKNFDSFKEINMKVILVGNKTEEDRKNKLECSFNGIVYDYTLYKCIKCKVCVRHVRPSSKHFCLIDAAKSKCPKCYLFFDEGKLKYHLKQHDTDPDFVRDNMLIVDFDPDSSKCLEKEEKKDSEDVKTKSEDETVAKNVIEKTDTVYKCACGLHHLTTTSYNEHSHKTKCDSKKKVNKQKCFKCGLDFTPNVLFKHLLCHHGDINVVYRLEVVEV